MLKSITFEVVGDQQLTCEGCEQRVERLLRALQGVRQVRARAHDQLVEVLFDTTVLDTDTLGERLRQAGYETRLSTPSFEATSTAAGANTGSGGKNWLRSLAMIPGAVLPLLPSATCPACVAAYAGLLSAVGLGFVLTERVLAPLIAFFLAVGILSVAWSTRSHRRFGPLVATLLGSAAVVMGRLTGHVPLLLYGGVGLLIGASVWNLWLRRPQRERLVAIGMKDPG